MVCLDWTLPDTIGGVLVREVTCVYDSSALLVEGTKMKKYHSLSDLQCHLFSRPGQLKREKIPIV